MMRQPHFILYGVQNSWYSAKVRSYLRCKGLPYQEQRPSLLTYYRAIPKRCTDPAVPVVLTPEGEWLQDSSVIIERLEQRFPMAPMLPATPVQRLFSYLVEAWADEFWHPCAEHTRFSFPENFPPWRDEVGKAFLPGFPQSMVNRVVQKPYRMMLEVTRKVGVIPAQLAAIERWTARQLDTLDTHFAGLPYLLGERPSIGDFALMGPLHGHLMFDPRSRRLLIEPRRHLWRWIERMGQPPAAGSDWLPGDRLPDTLLPLLRSIIDEFGPYLESCAQDARQWQAAAPTDGRFPRWGREAEFTLAGSPFRRSTMPYALWMAQRAFDCLAGMEDPARNAARAWLSAAGGGRLLALSFPRLRRVGLHAALELATPAS